MRHKNATFQIITELSKYAFCGNLEIYKTPTREPHRNQQTNEGKNRGIFWGRGEVNVGTMFFVGKGTFLEGWNLFEGRRTFFCGKQGCSVQFLSFLSEKRQFTGNCGVRSGKQKVTSQRHREGLVRSMHGNP